MTPPQRLPASLTPLDTALNALLDGIQPVAPVELPLAQALRCIAADMPPLTAYPTRDTAAADGFAFRARQQIAGQSDGGSFNHMSRHMMNMSICQCRLRSGHSMIREKPALGLGPRVETGFPKRSFSTAMLERQSIQSEAIAFWRRANIRTRWFE